MSQKKICVGLRHLRIKPARRESRPTMGRIQNSGVRRELVAGALRAGCCAVLAEFDDG